jgi:hypothetical protein
VIFRVLRLFKKQMKDKVQSKDGSNISTIAKDIQRRTGE